MSQPANPFAHSGQPGPRPDACGGALVTITAEERRSLERSGTVFSKSFANGSGRHDCRVRCGGIVETRLMRSQHEDPDAPADVRHVRLGLCSHCSALEAYVRRMRSEKP